ncbi:class I SAM-dependent methyltransferase [Enterococcus alcedinis]|uniref:Methyltransferase n=1 Tax=Enterococcus alcedinis TaxID=1274384 RepID=A0A917JFH4_9ENTE|nr:class I SAM-dependent methyltransferase [Enterococcus alcedinis]MBP2101490.1 16S rRNA (guanine1207-N2)-methyltransferase [Enterococcus alcedinis]GGI65117.1 methyltransferase [Enterococcus alcedinis]
MTNHYYSKSPDTAHEYAHWDFELKGKLFHFTTDSNVFSKGTIDFGSRVLIDAFDATDLPEGPLLDLGCGYGPIGLSLAYDTKRVVEMVDVNERALELAQTNAKQNKIENVEIHASYIYETLNHSAYAGILSNPPIRAGKQVVHEILVNAADLLLPGGTLTIVIQKKQGAPSAQKKMLETFGNAEIILKDRGYYIIQSVKEA